MPMLIERLPVPAVGTGLPPMVATLAAGLDVMMAAGAGVVAAAVIWGRMVEVLPCGTVGVAAVGGADEARAGAVGRVLVAGGVVRWVTGNGDCWAAVVAGGWDGGSAGVSVAGAVLE